jgi:hypothetical protein
MAQSGVPLCTTKYTLAHFKVINILKEKNNQPFANYYFISGKTNDCCE